MNKKEIKKKVGESKVKEPGIPYQRRKLEIFTSFKDENEATAKMNASLSAEDHLRIAHKMICAMYKEELAAGKQSHDTITFTVINGLPV